MISIRLPKDLEKRVTVLAEKSNLNKSDIVREALQEYLHKQEIKEAPYKLGEDLFGRQGSGDGSLSETYRQKVKDKIREKCAD